MILEWLSWLFTTLILFIVYLGFDWLTMMDILNYVDIIVLKILLSNNNT